VFHVNLVDFNGKIEFLHLVLCCSFPPVSRSDLSTFSSSSCFRSRFFTSVVGLVFLCSVPHRLATGPLDSFTAWASSVWISPPVRATRIGFSCCPETGSWFAALLAGPALCLSSFFCVRSGSWCSSTTQ
jgi:hypothetical protein